MMDKKNMKEERKKEHKEMKRIEIDITDKFNRLIRDGRDILIELSK